MLTCPPVPATVMALTAEVLALAKSAGAPVPRHELVVLLSDNQTAVVQERRSGEQIWRVDAHLIDAMIEVSDRFAGLLADRPDVPNPGPVGSEPGAGRGCDAGQVPPRPHAVGAYVTASSQ